MSVAKILIINDEPSIVRVMSMVLRKEGLEPEGRLSGLEGVEAAKQGKFDLILLDDGLQDIDGWAVLDRLRGEPKTASIPVIMVTTRGECESKAKEKGAAGLLNLPVSIDKLPTIVREHIGKRV